MMRSYYPLTRSQMGVYMECIRHPYSTQYNTSWSTLLDPGLDADRIEQAILQIYHTRPELRLHFTEEADGTPIQYVSDVELFVKRLHMTEDEACVYQKNGFDRPFSLNGDEPLMRAEILITEKNRYLLIVIHHLIADGTTDLLLFSHRDLSDAYEGKELQECGYGLLDYALDEKTLYSGKGYEKDKAFYTNRFEGMSFATLSDGSEKEGRLLSSKELLDHALVTDWCEKQEVPVNILFQAAFTYTLSVLLSEERVMVITENHGRYAKGLADSYGMFVNNTAVLSDTGGNKSVKEYFDQVRAENFSGMRHNHYPFMDLCSDMGLSSGARFNFLGFDHLEEASFFGEIKCPFTEMERNACFSDLGVSVFETPDTFEIRATSGEYQNPQERLDLFTRAMKAVALHMMEAPNAELCSISLLSAEDTDRVLSASVGATPDFADEKTWVDLFRERAQEYPDAPAVTDSLATITYKELDAASDRVAEYLVESGVEDNDFVAVKMGRTRAFVIAVLGINKAGAAYIPVDPAYPKDRIACILTDSEARYVLTEESMARILDGDKRNGSFVSRAKTDGLAYMIYTSGTTGKPKGAMIVHKGLRAFVAWNNKELRQGPDTSHLVHSSFSFDASVFDMICPLAAGASIHIADEELRSDLPALAAYIRSHHITGMLINTQIGMELLNHYDLSLRYLMLGGDKMLPVKKTKVCVYNAYGPTEFTAASSFYRVRGDEQVIPIGRPVPGSISLILDRNGNLLPPGAAGELCLSGIQMGAGYYKQPELTAEKFVTRSIPGIGESMIYRTGDLARYNEDGDLEYLGRIDDQIKLRGFRIELGEIENTAASYEGISAVAALVKKDAIVLYYTADETIDTDRLRAHLSRTLPEYMIPAFFMQLEGMPVAPGGKVDRKALPEPETRRRASYEEPENETERIIAECMQKILGLSDRIGRGDNFYELGGDSIKAIRMVSALRSEGINARTTWILQSRDLRELAALCAAAEKGTGIGPEGTFAGPVGESAILAFFKALKLPRPMHFNQSVLLGLETDTDVKLIEQALSALVRHHDILRAVMKEEQLIIEKDEGTVSLTKHQAADEEEITAICASFQESFEEGGPLLKTALITLDGATGKTERYLFMTAHHTIVDGVTWRILLDDLAEAYRQLTDGREVILPTKTAGYADYVKAQKAYAESYALSLEIPYWKKTKEQILRLSGSTENDYGRTFGSWDGQLGREDTKAFLAAPLDRVNATAEDVLLTAVSLAVRAVKGRDALSVRMEGHGREEFGSDLAFDRTAGWFTSVYPVVLADLTGNVWEDLLAVKETVHRVPGRGAGYGILQYLTNELSADDPLPELSFNYLGVMDEGNTNGVFTREMRISTGRDVALENTFGPGLAVNCMTAGGAFHLRLEYDRALYTEKEIVRIADEVFANIRAIGKLLAGQKDRSVTASDLGETEWTKEEFDAVYEKYVSRGERIQRIYPLTFMQEAMLLKHVSEPDSPAYRMAYIYELDGVLTKEKAQRVLSCLAAKYEVLRTAVIYRNVSKPRQAILDRKLGLTMKDIRGAKDPLREIYRIREEVLKNDFDPENRPLFRLLVARKDESTSYLIMAVHHMIIDGWCMNLLVSDLARLLKKEISGEAASCDTDGGSMDGVYERAVRESLLLDQRKGLTYFKELLSGYETRAEIPSYGPVPEEERSDQNEAVLHMDKETTDALKELCRQEQVTLSNAVELAWARVLSVCSRQDDVVFARVVSGRDKTGPDVTGIVGLFIRSVPVRVTFSADKSTRRMLAEIREQASGTNEFDFCSLSEIQKQTALGSGLFQTVFTFENYNSGLDLESVTGDTLYGLKNVLIKDENFDDVSPVSYVDEKGQLSLSLAFDVNKYRLKEMNRILALFELTILQMVKSPERALVTQPLLDEADEKCVIALSKSEALPCDKNATWLSVFRESVRRFSDRTAVVDKEESLTYEQLDKSSDALAAYLADKGVAPGDFVALTMPRVKEFIVAVLGIHKAGAAYVPIDTEYPKDRIRYMLEDSGAKVVLDDVSVKKAVTEYDGRFVEDRSRPEQLAYMIYTSGSTGRPKGVMFRHAGLMNCASAIVLENELTCTDRIGLHFSFSFDSHIEDTYPPLMCGASIYMMPEEIRRNPDAIYRFLTDHKINGCGFTTSLARLMIEHYELPLRYISPMGEALTDVTSDTVRILNKYGPTECCICSVYELEKGRRYADVPIGRALPNSYIFIVDSYGHLLPRGMAGELCYAGPQVGAGYHKLEELTREVFTDCPYVPGMRMYHTGDLARYAEDGNLLYLGRIDSQVKVNGYRVETGEIESLALRNPSVYEAAAVIRDNHVHLYYTVKGEEIGAEELKSEMEKLLPDYMIPESFIRLALMPHTPSGKIDRRALPAPEKAASENIAPRTAAEQQVLEVCLELLSVDHISVTSNLISAGLSSLGAMRLSLTLSGKTGRHVDIPEIMRHPTIEAIAKTLDGAQEAVRIRKCEERPYYPLSSNQQAVYVEWEKNRASTQYNIPYLYVLEGMDAARLADAVRKAVDAHPYLNNRFGIVDGEPVQMPGKEEIEISLERLDQEPGLSFFQDMVKPFDLQGECLSRFKIFTCEDRIWFFLDIHHSIFDGLSMTILVQDILRAYNGGTIQDEQISAYDAAVCEEERMTGAAHDRAKAFFRKELLHGEAAVFPESVRPDGRRVSQVISRMESGDIDRFCTEAGVTVSSLLQAAFAEALVRFLRVDDPVYLTVTNGRTEETLAHTVGMFIRTVPVACGVENRAALSGADYVKDMHRRLQEIYTFDSCPWAELADEYKLAPEVMFVYQDDLFEGGRIEGTRQIPLSLDRLKFPLCLTAFPEDGSYVIVLDYDGNRYGRREIQDFAKSIFCIAQGLTKNQRVRDIKNLEPDAEREAIALSAGDDLSCDFDRTWVDLFTENARRNPDDTAVVDKSGTLTCRELDALSDRVAEYLIAQGVKENDFVAVQMERVKEFVVAVLGINKAGAAYVPIDPSYPKERISFMLDDSGAVEVFTEESLKGILDGERETKTPGEAGRFVSRASGETFAYMIYTSGTTGRPKGVVVKHKGISACAAWQIPEFGLCRGKQNLNHPSFSFDASTFDLFYPLAAGATVHILDDVSRMSIEATGEYIRRNHITGMTTSTTVGLMLLNELALDMDYIMLGGDRFVPVKPTGTRLYNGYGPTEFTVCSSFHVIDQEKDQTIPIGRPVPGSSSFICDCYGNLLPRGVAGELCLSGAQMALGYHKQKELTAERFITIRIGRLGEAVRVYKTGDLARYNEEGELEFLGRVDDQVKIRGFRVEPAEVENRAVQIHGVTNAAVRVWGDVLVLYYTCDGDVEEEEIRAFLEQTLPEYMVPEICVKLPSMPVNENGKTDRDALPEPERKDQERKTPPQTRLEKQLFAFAADLLDTDDFGVTTSLVRMGLTSLKAMRLSSLIQRKLGVSLTVSDILKKPSIRGFEASIQEAAAGEGSKEAGIKAYEKREIYPITENQRGVYIDWELNQNTLQYNVPQVIVLKGVGTDAAQQAVTSVMNAHSYLKTRLTLIDGEIMQKRMDEEPVHITKEKLDREPEAGFFREKVLPFDLLQDPLYRIGLYAYGDTTWMFVDMHHIINDGLTGSLWIHDLAEALKGKDPAGEEITAFDVALSEEEWTRSDQYTKAEEYFDSLLAGAAAVSLPPSAFPDGDGMGTVEAGAPREAIDAFCKANEVTEASFLQAAFAETLYRLTREEKFFYATVSNGRSTDSRLDRTAGMFVRTLPVVREEESTKAVALSADYVKSMHGQLQESFAHERFPYTRMVEKSGVHARILFTCQGEILDEGILKEQGIGRIEMETDTVKFPIEMYAMPVKDQVIFHVAYDGSQYGRKDMQMLADAVANAAKELATRKKRTEVSLTDAVRQKELILSGTGEKLPVDPSETIVSMYRQRAAATPDATALVCEERSYTYGEVEELTDRLAACLVTEYQVEPGDIVGVLINRSEYMMIYPLAVMKAGAAYMPLDPQFPSGRLQFMCQDADVKVILTEDGLAGTSIPDFSGKIFDRSDREMSCAVLHGNALTKGGDIRLPKVKADDPMVLLYTSGSTGEPKAVILLHKGIVNFMHWYVKEYEVTENDRAGAYAAFGFDAHMIDLYSSVLAGASVYILTEELRRNLTELNAYYEENGITISFMTTQVGCLFSEMNKTLRVLTTGG
ncbi:MAG: amino acid adenylation domain-containing protein, partial [Lachnospiraceae bacterium]|nr:amino acid adenylation domain-containing protein [Lachnospiraceae bacterium]